LIGFLLVAIATAHAQTNSWIGTAGGFWETTNDWSLGVAPTNTQSAILITNAATKEVTISSSTTADMLTISNLFLSAPGSSTNTLALITATTPLTVLSNVTVGVGGAIRFFGSQLQVIGRVPSSIIVDGRVTLDGAAALSVTGRIEVGKSRNGTVLMQSGTMTAQVGMFVGESAGVTGTVWQLGGQAVINDANGSQWGTGGGVGNVTVSNGTMQVEALYLGRSAGLQSTLSLAGGTLTLKSFCLVGCDPGAGGAVWVSGGTLLATNITTTIGTQGNGQMTVSNGVVLAKSLTVGEFSNAQGTLAVAGGDTSVYSSLLVGSGSCSSTATVLVAGGNLFVTNAAHNAMLTINGGTLMLNGGTLTVDNLTINSACGRFIHTGGTLVVNGTITADPSFDSDGDGIPNGYEDAHGFDKFNPADAAQDADGDGMSNLQEYLEGTDPTNSASVFRIIEISQQGNDIHLTWTSGRNVTNALQRATGGPDGSYDTNNFTTIGTFSTIGPVGDITNSVTDSGAATNFPSAYYRLIRVP
jgi:T5SS/PEP-CTERM-associated repeat protein